MKRRMLWIVISMMAAFVLPSAGGYAGDAAGKKLTLMIYMCGSNLESSYGSASLDIQEMLGAKLNSRELNVLVMTGGSDVPEDAGFFSRSAAEIYEIGPGRIRRVWQSEEPLNMGRQDTLERLLQFGVTNRPAERYALILWDHGGGPLEGVCWDETHEMDHLSLKEVTGALKAVLKEDRLSWIGFDACLMGSLEVAGQLAPFAEYMIASQETEPASGWNYSFLSELHLDSDGAQTGRRIVDAYFEGQEQSREILTLACIDLHAAEEAITALDPVFVPLERRLGKEEFKELSGLRMSSVGFGKADPTALESGYDLVDARDLVSRMEQTEASENLLRLLDRAVVYSRASEEGACGLSLYHPYVNKTGYTDKWKDEYQAFSFSPGYQQYVASFGGMLTGESLFRWMNLFALSGGTDAEGNFLFEMPLTAEQRENLVSAQLLILRDSDGSRLEDNCVVLASCPAKIGEDGAVRAEWDGSCLYAEKEDGKLVGPVPFLLTDDGKMKTVIGNYIPEGNYDLDGQMVLYEMDAEDSAEYPEIIRTRVWDEATGSFSSRMRFSEEGYGTLMLYSYHRKYPEAGADQVLPDYQKWEPDSNLLYANTIVLPDAWRLRSSKRESGEQRYAVFRLVDSQQNVVCSLPAAVPNAWRREIPSAGGEIADQNLRAELSCTVNTSPDEYGLQMDWIFENRGTEKISVTLRNLVLNGSRQTDTSVYSILQPGETELETQAFKKYEPLWLDTLESISGTASIRPDGGEEYKVPFEFRFDHDDLSPVNRAEELLAETEQDGIELKLISLEPDTECGWNVTFCLENRTDTAFEEGEYILLNGIRADYWQVDALGPGESRIETRCLNNLATFSWFKALDLPEYAVVYPEMNLMQVLGENLLQEITLISKGENHRTNRRTLTLSEPVPTGERRRSRDAELLLPGIRPPEELPDPREDALPVLRENNIYQVTLRRLLTGNGEIGLTLGLENRSGLWLELEAGECRVNGQPVGTVDFSNRFLPPDSFCVATCVLKEESLSPGTEIRELSLIIYDSTREQDPEACVLTVSPGLCMGDLSWLNGEELTGEPIYAPDVDMEAELNPRLLETEILLPENAKSFRMEVEVEMTPEELAGVKSAKIALMRSAKDGYMQMLTLQDWAPTEEGTFHFPYPGLFPVLAGEEQAVVLTYWKVDDQEVSGTVRASVMLTTNDFDIVNLEDIRWTLSQEDQSAKVTSFTQDGAPYGYQSDLAIASVSRIELLPVQGEDGTLPHMADMELHGGFEFNTFLNWPGVQLYGKPMQLSLRPALPEEELYFLISITRKDGSRYSLPLIPYNGHVSGSVQ